MCIAMYAMHGKWSAFAAQIAERLNMNSHVVKSMDNYIGQLKIAKRLNVNSHVWNAWKTINVCNTTPRGVEYYELIITDVVQPRSGLGSRWFYVAMGFAHSYSHSSPLGLFYALHRGVSVLLTGQLYSAFDGFWKFIIDIFHQIQFHALSAIQSIHL